jgi:hypothetical protein
VPAIVRMPYTDIEQGAVMVGGPAVTLRLQDKHAANCRRGDRYLVRAVVYSAIYCRPTDAGEVEIALAKVP